MRSISKKKRGSMDAAGAATLVALIGALIILYILFLPPGFRQELLEGNLSDDGSTVNESSNILLDELPGKLYYFSDSEYEHDLPSVTLVRQTNSEVIFEGNSATLKSSWFDKKSERMSFQVKDIANTDRVILSFQAPENDGALSIWLNSNLIFEQDVSGQPSPIMIPKALLAGSNTLEFAVSGVGMAFWKTNRYSLQNIQVTADVTDLSRQESISLVVLKTVEKDNLESAVLKFTPECDSGSVGVLDISVNNIPVYSAVPDCKVRNTINIPRGVFVSQENRVGFKTNKGSYAIDQVKLNTQLKKDPLIVYYFDLDDDQYKEVQDRTKRLQLEATLVRTDEVKEANFIVNGHITAMWTRDYEFAKVIDKTWVFKGSNYVRIEPKSDLEMARLKVYLRKP